jgi:hypothetical protein
MRFFSVVLFLLLISCEVNSQVAGKQPVLASMEQFIEMSSKPLYQKYGQVSSVKVVFDNRYDSLHFISSKSYDYHFEYCMDVLGYGGDLGQFNDEAYSGEDSRRFLIANINYYKALDVFTLELGPSDRMNQQHMLKLYNAVSKQVYFDNRFYFMLNTTHVIESLGEKPIIPTISPSDIYDNQEYQPISKYKGVGKLKVIHNWEEEYPSIQPTDIIVLDDIPAVFPLVSGVIVTQFQTPLSHVTLLGQNRKIPICAYTKAYSFNEIMDLDGKVVSFEVKQDSLLLEPSNVDLSTYWKSNKRIQLSKSLHVDSLIPGRLLRDRLSSVVGNKAAYFGELMRYAKRIDYKTPESAFAIPFSFYEDHIKTNKVQSLIDNLLKKDNRKRSVIEVRSDLEKIRKAILSSEVDSKLVDAVEQMILRSGKYRRMRFRSSTNAEDREGFSGAGIYTSKTGEIGNPSKPIDKAIKKVWASLWSYNAFMEREAFNFDHSTVSMGILVHRSFPDEEVNGVAITSNLYRKDYFGFVVNAQLGDESVVQPNDSIQCDEFICYPDETTSFYGQTKGGIDIINYSSLNGGELVMTTEEIQHLANVLEQIKRRYLRTRYIKTSYFNFALDIEFKLDKDTRQLYIKQMRVYNK